MLQYFVTKMEHDQNVQEKFLKKKDENTGKIKAYKRRWIILLIFTIYATINAYQWIEYSSITHVVAKYYHVSTLAVDWTSIIYMALYPIFVIPASYIIDKKGLRTAGLIGCIGTALGTGIKVFSIRNDLFWVVLCGQAIVSASQVVIICLPPKIAAVWFKPNEVSTACSLGVIGSQVGVAAGYLLSPIFVRDSDNLEDIGAGLKQLCWLLAGSMIPVTVAVLLYFPNEPPLPPSVAQAVIREKREVFQAKTFFTSLKKLFLNRPFVIHMVAYGLNIGASSAVGTLLNQFILQYFQGASEDSGRMGFVSVIAGIIGMFVFGIILDKTHKYKETTLFIYFGCVISGVFLMYALKWRWLWLSYIACGALGIFVNAYMPVGFELAMELTFPMEESTTSGILMAMTQLLGTPFAVIAGIINKSIGGFLTIGVLSAIMLLGTIITAFIPNKLLRQQAFNNNSDLRKESHHGSRLVYIP